VDKSSCAPREPFIRLGAGQAPGLNYNLPQRTAFSVYGRIPSGIPASWFQDFASKEPTVNWWQKTAGLSVDDIRIQVTDAIATPFSPSAIIRNGDRLRKFVPATAPSRTSAARAARTARTAISLEQVDGLVAGIKDGLMPVATETFGGGPIICWIPKPVPSPSIYIIEEYTVASYLGDYGAGKTVSTFSLLPGETTVISVRTYTESTETETQSENVLDSFTEESADEFETTLAEESGETVTETESNSSGSTAEVALMIDLFGIIKVGGETQPELSESTSASRETNVTTTTNALEKHVTKTSSYREVEVNTTSTTTVTTGAENTTTRTLENINKSRVLNFVFRQLQQEFVTLVYLKNVRFLYSNGFGESVVLADIPKLQAMVEDKVKPEHVKEAMSKLLKSYCLVYNHNGVGIPFIEKVTEDLKGCSFAEPPEKVTYWRKRPKLVDSEAGIEVPGVILRVHRSIVPTPALIVDALLAGGESLDCYNQEMQEAAVKAVDLANEKIEVALRTLGEITDPAARAEAYQTMFYAPPAPGEDTSTDAS